MGTGWSRPGLRGREAELARLAGLLESARAGSGAVALLLGEAGIGKTVLLEETAAAARAQGFSVSLSRAEELHEMAPLSTLVSGLLHGADPLLSAADLGPLTSHHDQRIWLVERLAAAIEERAAASPVLIALDDVQWADPLSRFALGHLPERLRASPVLWLLAGRQHPRIGSGSIPVPLRPLASAAIGQLAGDVLGEVPESVLDLLDGAGGNPFLAAEMLAGLRGREGADGPPERLVLGVRGRLSSLAPGTLDFLRKGAVLGRSFRLSDAAALAGRPAVDLLAELEEATRGGLLDDDGERLTFRHDLLRQAVYADISPSVRRALHRAAAGRLVAAGSPAAEAAPHLLKGAEPGDDEAVDLLVAAAEEALPLMPDFAGDLLARAHDLVPASQPRAFALGERMITVRTRAGRFAEAVATADALLARQPTLPDFARIQAAVGTALWNLDEIGDLARRADAALAVADDPGTAAELAALRALALSRGRDLDAAREAGAQALARADAVGGREARTSALWAMGEIELNAGDCAAALHHHQVLCTIDPEYRPEEIVALLHHDEFAAAARLLAAAAGGSRRPVMQLWAQGNHHLGLGRLDDADADLLTLDRLEEKEGTSIHRVNSRILRGWTALARGHRAEAADHLEAATASVRARPNRGNEAGTRFLRALLAAPDEAADQVRRIQREAPFVRWRLLRPWFADAVRIAVAAGDRRLAEELADQAADHAARNPGVPTPAGTAAHAAALAHGDTGRLRLAVELLEGGPRPLPLAAASADLGRALAEEGEGTASAAALARAHDLYTAAGAWGLAAAAGGEPAEQGAPARPAQTERPLQGWGALTASERKVAHLIAEGHTNRSAAETLVVSPHTVNTHLVAVFRKLGVNSRVQLTRLALAEEAG
ncbi:ATP-binding protein [Actinocorallia aurea]